MKIIPVFHNRRKHENIIIYCCCSKSLEQKDVIDDRLYRSIRLIFNYIVFAFLPFNIGEDKDKTKIIIQIL